MTDPAGLAGTCFKDVIVAAPLPKHELWPLLESASGRSREFILAHDTDAMDAGARALFGHWVARRRDGVPVAYLIGSREFYGRPFWVNRHTLIPRMETELLIDTVKQIWPKASSQPRRLCDLGTGSGCVAITLALEFPQATVHATDQSAKALQAARNNAAWLGAASRMRFHQGSWWDALNVDSPDRFDGIVSNPPYIAPEDHHLSQGDLRFEPPAALVGRDLGLGDIQAIVAGARKRLEPNGFLLIEHGYDQQAAVKDLFQNEGFGRVQGLLDLANNPRAVLGFQPKDEAQTLPTR